MEHDIYTKDEITDRLGADNWDVVANEFRGKTMKEIMAVLNYMFPEKYKEAMENKYKLANSILREI